MHIYIYIYIHRFKHSFTWNTEWMCVHLYMRQPGFIFSASNSINQKIEMQLLESCVLFWLIVSTHVYPRGLLRWSSAYHTRARSRYQRQGQVITPHSIGGMLLLVPALGVCSWHTGPRTSIWCKICDQNRPSECGIPYFRPSVRAKMIKNEMVLYPGPILQILINLNPNLDT